MKIRLFINDKLASKDLLELRKDHTHYLANVLRVKTGRELFVFNPFDGEFRAEYVEKGKIKLAEQTIKPLTEPNLTLIFAPIKFGKIDYLIQKATELGVTKFQPVQTQHTMVSKLKYDRLSANAIEAAEQTGRITLPQIEQIKPLKKLIDSWDAKQKILFCDESGEGDSFKAVLEKMPKAAKDFAILIGPEGGFSEDEQKLLKKQKFVYPASMGKRILRAETAALAALGAFQAISGDWR